MAGTGPVSKAPGVSARSKSHKKSTRATLSEPTEDEIDIPPLPTRYKLVKGKGDEGEHYVESSWHPLTAEWWVDLWESPMSSEFHSSDRHGLFRLAALIDNFWQRPNSDTHSEVRLAQKDYGLTPMDRRRLEWTIESAKEAKEKGDKRRQKDATTATAPTAAEKDPAKDPRVALADNVVAIKR